MKKPGEQILVFVGSSSESLEIANAVQVNIEVRNVKATVWKQGVFKPGEFGLDSLIEISKTHDFGVFVFAPDDVVRIRNEQHTTVRDNVIFELGLFMGRLGRSRTFVIVPQGVTLHLPSDLDGWNTVHYDSKRGNSFAAVATACSQILQEIEAQGRFRPEQPTREVFSSAAPAERPASGFALATKKQKTKVRPLGASSRPEVNRQRKIPKKK